MQLAAHNDVKASDVPCTVDGGKDNGKDCAYRDYMVGKVQGFGMGYGRGVQQLIKTYMKAYRFGLCLLHLCVWDVCERDDFLMF